LRQFGVLLSDAALKDEALALGLEVSTGALSAQTKILAAQSLIYKQTGDAQGDFARTSDGLANSSRVLKAQMADLQVSIGKALLPAVQAVLPYLKNFADWAQTNPRTFLVVAGTITAVATAIMAVNIAMALNPFGLVVAGTALAGLAIYGLSQKFESFGNVVKNIINSVINYVNGLVSAMYMVYNAAALIINAIPGVDNIPTANAPQIPLLGSGTAAAVGSGFAREGGTGSIGSVNLPNIASIPILSPAVTGGGGGGGGGSGGTLSAPSNGAMAMSAFSQGVAERMANRESAITVNVNGGISTSAQIGQAVYDSLLQYKQVYGPLNELS